MGPNSATRLLHLLAHFDEDGVLEVLQPAGHPAGHPASILYVALAQWREEGRPTSTTLLPAQQEEEQELSPIEVLALLLDLYDAPGASDGPEADELWARARELVLAAASGEGR